MTAVSNQILPPIHSSKRRTHVYAVNLILLLDLTVYMRYYSELKLNFPLQQCKANVEQKPTSFILES